jgi:outer membrane protein assembly factor BamB
MGATPLPSRLVRTATALGAAVVLAIGGVAALPGQAAASSASWTQFHYAATKSGYNPRETTLNPGNVPGVKLIWQRQFANETVYGTPLVSGNRVYTLGYYGELFALDRATGKVVWSKKTGTTSNSTPALWSSYVIAPANDSHGAYLAAFAQKNGSRKWLTRLTTDQYAHVTQPTVYGSTVYVSTGYVLYAVSASSGRILWHRTLTSAEYGNVDGPVAVSGGGEYVIAAGNDGYVYALNAATGKLAWNVRAGGGIHSGGPAIYNGIVYVPEGNFGSEGGGFNIWAIQVSDGYILWHSYAGDDVHVTPAAGAGIVAIGSIDEGVVVLNASTGATLWTAPYEGEVWGSPVIANGVVYVGTDAGLLAYDAANGTKVWVSNFGMGMANMSSPAVIDGRIYTGTGEGGVLVFGL